jgi:ABC-2 type transport system permease protein
VIALVRSESIKLRTVVMHWVLLTIALAFPLVVTLLTAFFNGDDDGWSARQLVEVLSGTSFLAVLLIGVTAAASVTGEFGFGTIRPTFTATPKRANVIAAKALVLVAAALAVQTAVVVIGSLVGTLIAEGRGATVDLGSVDAGINTLIGSIVLAGLMAVMGLGLGLLVRSTPAAVAALILWPLLVENLLGGLLGLIFDNTNVASWMPFRAGFSMATLEPFDGPSRLVAGIYFGAVAVALLALGTWSVNRRDA